jgi:hypothetical protein
VPDAVMRKVVNLLADVEAGLIQLPGQPAAGSSAESPHQSRAQS